MNILFTVLQQYLTLDSQCVRLFLSDGRKSKTYGLEEPVDNIAHCPHFKQFVGWISGEDELFVSICCLFRIV